MADKRMAVDALQRKLGELSQRAYIKAREGKLTPQLEDSIDLQKKRLKDAIEKRVKEVSDIRDPSRVINTREEIARIKNPAERIDTLSKQKISGVGDALRRNAKKSQLMKLIKMAGKKSLKALPIIGGAASALSSGDVSAAVPILGDAERLGPARGSLGATIEDPSQSREARRLAIKELKRQMGKR